MPLPKRLVQPVLVARNTLPEDYPLPNELEAVTNGTLANAVRQLSSLSQHAEDLFGELARDAQQLHDRSNSLQARIDRLAIKVTQLDSTVEEVSLQDIHKRKAFKSSNSFDQQIFSRNTMPAAMQEMYACCDKPPPLDKLNCYREDGKDGLKFYTDPNFFFELWKQEMMDVTVKAMQGKKAHRQRNSSQNPESGRRGKKQVRQPQKASEKYVQLAYARGEHIQDMGTLRPGAYQNNRQSMQQYYVEDDRPNRPNSIEIRRSYQHEVVDGMQTPVYQYHPNVEQQYAAGDQHYGSNNDGIYQPGTPTRKARPSQPPPAPPSNQATPTANTPTRGGRGVSMGRDALPPPPPPPEGVPLSPPPPNGIPPHLVRQSSQSRSNSPHSQHGGTPEPPQQQQQDLPPPPPVPKQASPPKQVVIQPVVAAAPPPPPPPPLPMMGDGPNAVSSPPPPAFNGDLIRQLNSNPKLTPPKERPSQKAPPMVDPRNDLLKAIRDGIKLRKVEKIEQKEVERGGNGFHDVASILARRVAVEFSDSESGSDSDDSEGWGENETSA